MAKPDFADYGPFDVAALAAPHIVGISDHEISVNRAHFAARPGIAAIARDAMEAGYDRRAVRDACLARVAELEAAGRYRGTV